ncbi:MAG: hypothetical protein ABEJ98_05885, partial [Candidatus Nanohaloarchaea archaeon]
MKGLGGLMVMMAALVLAISVAGFSVPVTQSLAAEATEAITDVSAISRVNAYTSNYAYDHLRQAARYSLHNRSYSLGQDAGGENWTGKKVSRPLNRTYRCGKENILQQLNCNLEQDVSQRTVRYRLEGSSRCNPAVKNATFNYARREEEFSAGTVAMRCRLNGRTVSRTIDNLSISFNGSRARYSLLAHTAYSYMHRLSNSWEAGQYSGESYSCGSPSDEDFAEAEQEAADAADAAIQNSFDSIDASPPEGVSLTSSIVDTPDELAYGTDPENFAEAEQEVEVREGGCCARNDKGQCTAYDHDVYMNITPERSVA